MSTLQERQKVRAANHEARVADSKKSLGQKVGNFFTRRNTASASAPANKRMTTYKVFKGYTPKNKRSLPLGNNRNIVWDLAVNKPNDGVVNKAKARYLKLLKGFANLKDKTEFYTLYQLLKDKNLFGNIKEGPTGGIARNYRNEIQYNAPTPAAAPAASSAPAAASAPANAAANAAAPAPSAAPAAAPSPSAAPANAAKPSSAAAPANAANSGNPTPPASGATPANSNAGDPESIEGTIKKMKCTVCKSQEIISTALGKPFTPCNKCNTVAASAATPAAANPNLGPIQVVVQNNSTEEGLTGPRVHHNENSVGAKAPTLLGKHTEISRGATAPHIYEQTLPVGARGNQHLGGRRSRRRHRKTSRRTKNKRSTRRR